MSNVIKFEDKATKEIKAKLEQLKKISAETRKILESQEVTWVLIDRQGFMKTIKGHRNYPPEWRVAVSKPPQITLGKPSGPSIRDNLEIKIFYRDEIKEDGTAIFREY